MTTGRRLTVLCLLLALASITAAAGGARAERLIATGATLDFFEKQVRPILATHCYACHGPEKQKSDLRWDHIDFALRGGSRGPALVPGEPDRSRMIEAIGYETDLQMPPKSKLRDEQIAVLRKWVAMGAPWPEEPVPSGGVKIEPFDLTQRWSEHWAWHFEKDVKPPKVRDEAWPRTAIDRFILAKLEAAGLKPAPDTDRRTLIRRASFDVIGLPPTPAQVAAFVSDPAPTHEAFERVIDELLASPRFGERWGRHWLDLVRYAESYGHEYDYSIHEPWRYRDYVIRALNDDLPYDRFVLEHIAGDLVDKPRMHPTDGCNESLVATGWWYLHEQTHAPTDVRQHEADRVDNQIDVLSKAFLGLTVACARCHDHKFDAISTKDYYALAGFLQSSRQQLAYLDPDNRIGERVAEMRALYGEANAALLKAGVNGGVPTHFEHDKSVLFEDFNDGAFGGWRATGWAWGAAPTGPSQWDVHHTDGVAALPVGVAHSGRLGGSLHGTLCSPEFDLDHKQVHLRVKGEGEARVIVAGYTLEPFNALLFRGTRTKIDTKGEWKWITIAGELYLHLGQRAHLQIDDEGDGYLMIDEVRFGDQGAPGEPGDAAAPGMTQGAIAARLAALREQMREIEAKLPKPMRVLAITEGTGENEYVFIRGSWKSEGEEAPRQFLEAIAGEQATLGEGPGVGSGRLELARRMLDPDSGGPYVSRTIVNRIWHHLTGRGLVATTDNFGVLGQPPTHPALLDYLTAEMPRMGWSIKAMIKRVMMSRVYQMASAPAQADAASAEQDPANALLHRMRVRRLEGEAIRDAMLAVSGSLDTRMFGAPVPVHLTPFMEGRGRPGQSGPIDGNGRRSIYLSVRRNFLSPMFLAFDTPIPFTTIGRRTRSNVPAQALILMNDPFVQEQAKRWAQRVLSEKDLTPSQRIERMYVEALGRPPRADEIEAMLGFFEAQSQEYGLTGQQAATHEALWADLAHVMLNLKEFIFIE